MQTEAFISDQISNSVRDIRIKAQNIENLDEILRKIEPNVELATFRIDEDQDKSTSSILSYMLGMFTMLILYMFILLYGNMVMTSIIEEKSNRVLELVVSSVKPAQLMAGKIMGIGLVALTQVLIWTILVLACTVFLMPTMIGMASNSDPSMAAAMSQLADVGFIVETHAVHDGLPHRRLPVLCIDIRRYRIGRRQHSGCLAAAVDRCRTYHSGYRNSHERGQ